MGRDGGSWRDAQPQAGLQVLGLILCPLAPREGAALHVSPGRCWALNENMAYWWIIRIPILLASLVGGHPPAPCLSENSSPAPGSQRRVGGVAVSPPGQVPAEPSRGALASKASR